MQLPWGCHFPIGSCFNVVNSGLHTLGTGAYHVGIEVRQAQPQFNVPNLGCEISLLCLALFFIRLMESNTLTVPMTRKD